MVDDLCLLYLKYRVRILSGHGAKGKDRSSEFTGYLVGFQLLCGFGILWASLGIDRWDVIF